MAHVVTSSIDPTSHRTRSSMILPKEYSTHPSIIPFSLSATVCHVILFLFLFYFYFLFLFLLSFIIFIFLVFYYTYFCQYFTVSVLNCKIVFALEGTCPRAGNKYLFFSLFFESLYSTCNSLFDTLSLISSLDSKCK